MSKLANMLRTSAEADKAKALLTLELLENHPAGIGDHSTKDFYSNAEEALQMLVDADDRLEAIEKYLSGETGLINGYSTTTT
jgi:hypothetical protein|tara:strand:+ start:825 stop:1070 length:246 start_codon:yes stop_codon:yes gene_type:complete